MATKFYTSINLNGNQIQNVKAEIVTTKQAFTDSSLHEARFIYYKPTDDPSTTSGLYYSNGNKWVLLASATDNTRLAYTTDKNKMTIDGSLKSGDFYLGDVVTKTADTSLADGTNTDDTLPTSKAVKDYVDASITSLSFDASTIAGKALSRVVRADGSVATEGIQVINTIKLGTVSADLEAATATATIYTDGTYNSATNKIATVSTVTNAINALDAVKDATLGYAITGITETDGVITEIRGSKMYTHADASVWDVKVDGTSIVNSSTASLTTDPSSVYNATTNVLATKGTVNNAIQNLGRATAESGKYISDVSVDETGKFKITTTALATGEKHAEAGSYVSGVTLTATGLTVDTSAAITTFDNVVDASTELATSGAINKFVNNKIKELAGGVRYIGKVDTDTTYTTFDTAIEHKYTSMSLTAKAGDLILWKGDTSIYSEYLCVDASKYKSLENGWEKLGANTYVSSFGGKTGAITLDASVLEMAENTLKVRVDDTETNGFKIGITDSTGIKLYAPEYIVNKIGDLAGTISLGNGLIANTSTNTIDVSVNTTASNGAALVKDASGIKVTLDLANDSSNGAMSSAHYNKLEAIEHGAQVNVIEGVKHNGTALTLDSSKCVDVVTRFAKDLDESDAADASSFTLAHGLGTADITVTLYEKGTPNEVVYTDVKVDATNITINFGSNVKGSNFRVVATC